MSTRSIIAKENSNGTITAIHCSYDGYINCYTKKGVGEELYRNYKTEEKIDELLALGNLFSLGPTINITKAHTRSRGFSNEEPSTTYKNLMEFGRKAYSDFDFDFAYLWMNDQWYYWPVDEFRKMIRKGEGYPLSQEFC